MEEIENDEDKAQQLAVYKKLLSISEGIDIDKIWVAMLITTMHVSNGTKQYLLQF